MSASIRKRGNGRYAVITESRQLAQRCRHCTRTVTRRGREVALHKIHWLRDGEDPITKCRRCGTPLPPPIEERRQRWERKSSLGEAKRDRAKRVVQKAEGEYVEPSDLTLRAYLEERWLAQLDVAPTTFESYVACVRAHIVPALGGKRVQQLKGEDVKSFLQRLLTAGRRGGGGLSPKSVRNVHVVLRKALADAVDSHLVLRNVAAGRKIAPKAKKETRDMNVWTPEEVAAFLDHVKNNRLFALYRLLCSTGMRRGEAPGVRWRDIDLDGARVAVTGALVRVTYKRAERSTPKNGKAHGSSTSTPQRWRPFARIALASSRSASPCVSAGWVRKISCSPILMASHCIRTRSQTSS